MEELKIIPVRKAEELLFPPKEDMTSLYFDNYFYGYFMRYCTTTSTDQCFPSFIKHLTEDVLLKMSHSEKIDAIFCAIVEYWKDAKIERTYAESETIDDYGIRRKKTTVFDIMTKLLNLMKRNLQVYMDYDDPLLLHNLEILDSYHCTLQFIYFDNSKKQAPKYQYDCFINELIFAWPLLLGMIKNE